MTPKQFRTIRKMMEEWLGQEGEDGNHPEWCYESLSHDMAKAAQLVYDASMEAQKFANAQRS